MKIPTTIAFGVFIVFSGCDFRTPHASENTPHPFPVESSAALPTTLRSKGEIIGLNLNDENPKFDAYFTFSGFYPTQHEDDTTYYWNGKAMGKGRDGFLRIVDQMVAMPIGSTILEFPRIDNVAVNGDIPMMDCPPYLNQQNILKRVIFGNRLKLVRSLKDTSGKIVETPIVARLRRGGKFESTE